MFFYFWVIILNNLFYIYSIMNRPGIPQLPSRRQTLSDLKLMRESKKSILFKTRILPPPRTVMPNITSKSLKKKIVDLYPEIQQKMKERQKEQRRMRQQEIQRQNEPNPQDSLRMTHGFSTSLNIRHKKKQKQYSLSPIRPMHKSTKILMSTINVRNYIPLFHD